MSFYRVIRFFLKPVALLIWPTKVVNIENYEAFGGGLIMINHYSTLDGIIPAAKMFKKELHVIIKTEAFEGSKIANWFLKKVGGIPVHRGEADIDAVKAVMQVLKADKQLLIFPEGTRNKTNPTELLEFKDGAARFAMKTQKPILPMMYYQPPKAFRRNWLYVGEPFDLSQFYGDKPTEENKRKATQFVYGKMLETRRLLNEYVENGKKKSKTEKEKK